jgi:hypothetical protein
LRVGTATHQFALGTRGVAGVAFPALVPFLGRASLVLAADADAMRPAIHAAQAVLIRLLAALPPKSVSISSIDPTGLGSNFVELNRLHETVRGAEPRSVQRDVAAELERALDLVSRRNSQLQSTTIEDYNAHPGITPEPYLVLAIAGFPAEFNPTMVDHLQRLIQNGPRVGVLCVVVHDRSAGVARWAERVNVGAALAGATRIEHGPEGFRVAGESPLARFVIALDTPPPPEMIDRLDGGLRSGRDRARRPAVPGHVVLPEAWWTEPVDGLRAPVGLAGREAVAIELGRDRSHHVLIGGQTGSGKTVLLHTLILSLCTRYSPRDLELYLVDFKEGVELRPYRHLPHARVLLIEGAPSRGIEVLRRVQGLVVERGKRFREAGVTQIQEFRARAGRLPYVVLVVDEFHRLFSRAEDGAVANTILDALLREARSFGVHVVLASQRPPSALSRDARGQLATRIALRMSPADIAEILPESPEAAHLTEAGEAIINNASGARGANKFFRVARMEAGDVENIVARLADMAVQSGLASTPQVFDGAANAGAVAQSIHDLLGTERWTESVTEDGLDVKFGWDLDSPGDVARFSMHGKHGQHAFVSGATNSGKSALLHTILLSLATRYSPLELELFLVDFAQVEFQFYRGLPHARFILDRANRELGMAMLRHLCEEMERREALFAKAGVKRLLDYRQQGHALPLVLLVMDEFQVLFPDWQGESIEAGKLLDAVARRGRKVGIHALLATQTLRGVELPDGLKQQFMIRIAMQMRREDFWSFMSERKADILDRLRFPGQGILNEEGGVESAHRLFHAAYAKSAEITAIVQELAALSAQRGLEARQRVISVDDGAQVSESRWSTQPPAVAATVSIALGELFTVAGGDALAPLTRARGGNVLVSADDAEDAVAVLASAIASFRRAAGYGEGLVIDGSALGDLGAHFSEWASLGEGWKAVGLTGFADVGAELDRRAAAPEACARPLLVVVWAAPPHDTLTVLTPMRPPKLDPPLSTLMRLAESGPSRGVHLLLCVDGFGTAARILGGSGPMRDLFNTRLALASKEAARVIADPPPPEPHLARHHGVLVTPQGRQGRRMRTYRFEDVPHILAASGGP